MKKLVVLYSIIFLEICVLGFIVVSENRMNEVQHNNEGIEKNIIEKEKVTKSKDTEEKKSSKDDSEKIKSQIISKEELKKRIEEKMNSGDKDVSLNEEEIEEILKEEAISVFKVDCSEIKGDLSLGAKKDMVKIALKINMKLFNEIKDLLYHDNQEYGVLKSLLLLKENLNEKDFEVVKKVSDKYVDIDRVEDYYELEKNGTYN